MMKKLLKPLFLMIVVGVIVGVIVGAIASMAAKKRLEAMSDDEIRSYLASKLDGKIGEEQLLTVQDAAVARIRRAGKRAVVGTEADANGDSENAEPDDAESEVAETGSDDGS